MTAAAMPKPYPLAWHGGALKLHRGVHFGEVSIVQPDTITKAEHRVCCAGPTLAVNNYSLGVAANSGTRRSGRGGARNRADRVSHSLSASQVWKLIAAAGHASAIGLPLNRMITIHWQTAGVSLEPMAWATGRFVDLLSKAVARHDSSTAWLWVHENGDGKGGHCHLLVHVPPSAVETISKLQKGWLRRITGKPYKAKVIRSRPIGFRLGLEATNPGLHTVNLDAALSYCLKGAAPAAAERFGLSRIESGGRIIGKRCAASQNIGSKARRRSQS